MSPNERFVGVANIYFAGTQPTAAPPDAADQGADGGADGDGAGHAGTAGSYSVLHGARAAPANSPFRAQGGAFTICVARTGDCITMFALTAAGSC
ncbi:hypothetical protein K8O92_29435 [Nocardia asteroides]|nr:hypothetical protein K8O92_29435 [Nocardia asteroides]